MASKGVALALCALGASAAAAAPSPSQYVPTPAGYMRSDCVHRVPSGSTVTRTSAGMRVLEPGGAERVLPTCAVSNDETGPVTLSKASVEAAALRGRALQLPADYDGWLQYAAFEYTGSPGLSAFLCNLTCPSSLPRGTPDVLYFFPGLQNKDWVPKVDPYSGGAGFDILQPVLQYPGDSGGYYSVKSWWVTIDEGAVASDEIALVPGDVIVTNMTKTGAARWVIDSVVPGKGRTTVTADNLGPRLSSQPWAYTGVMECYGCTSCDMLPSHNASATFSGMVLLDESGAPITPVWVANPKPARDRTCPSSIEIVDSATVVTFPGTAA